MMEEEMNVSTESVDTLFFKQAEGREVEWAALSGTHPLPTGDSSSSLLTFKVGLGNPTGCPPSPGRICEAPSLVLPSFTSQGIETQRAESRALTNGSGESQEAVVTRVGAQLT